MEGVKLLHIYWLICNSWFLHVCIFFRYRSLPYLLFRHPPRLCFRSLHLVCYTFEITEIEWQRSGRLSLTLGTFAHNLLCDVHPYFFVCYSHLLSLCFLLFNMSMS